MLRRFFVSCVLASAFLSSGCGTDANLGSATEADQQAVLAAARSAPRFQGGEKIRINVYGEDKLSGNYEIDPNGLVSIPLAGTVRALGLTQHELERELARQLRTQYLRNPRVTVTILEFRPIYIVGEVEKQGEYPYKSGLNALTAVALAGGTTYRGSRDTVLIQHVGEKGMKSYPMSAATLILPGDLVRVPERYF